jgi:uncharacterized membrane protein YhhN
MYGRRLDPRTSVDPLFSIAAVLIFAWLLIAIGGVTVNVITYVLLMVATALVAMAVYRQRS